MATGAIVLAAGSSQRFGSPKLLAALPEGGSVISQTLTRLSAALPQLLIVTRPALESAIGAAAQEAATAQQARVQVLVCPQAEQGMASSLAFAATRLPADWQAALVCLGDMPFIRRETYHAIAAAIAAAIADAPAESATPAKIVVPEFQGRPGNPVAFSAAFFPQLTALSGDGGARPLLRANPQALQRLPVDDQGILIDVDRAEDLRHH